MSLRPFLLDACQQMALPVSDNQIDRLLALLEALLKWNTAFNLTAIREPKQALILHLLDSLSVLPQMGDGSLLDVGTGPGFPALPLAIMRPELAVTALDSNGKKIRFIRQISHELGLANITPVQARVEAHQGQYQQIVSRAFSELAPFVQISEHLLASGGVWLAMKSQRADEEREQLGSLFRCETVELQVPGLDAYRCLVRVQRATENS